MSGDPSERELAHFSCPVGAQLPVCLETSCAEFTSSAGRFSPIKRCTRRSPGRPAGPRSTDQTSTRTKPRFDLTRDQGVAESSERPSADLVARRASLIAPSNARAVIKCVYVDEYWEATIQAHFPPGSSRRVLRETSPHPSTCTEIGVRVLGWFLHRNHAHALEAGNNQAMAAVDEIIVLIQNPAFFIAPVEPARFQVV